ncbi:MULTISPECIES: type IV toxin-antitoxin system AbiEi family antitoxin domain-containing protein [Burkholderia]|uniref:type IV toxin-antitoxin system AbiEi family antitoxin domain-containing protein n=1 Tax=Burkholderia TaxID=32008 RepID=UPI0009C0DBD6|nr:MULTISPECIES: type IV toxin-antitoxin system AbiEi family antitoxin domain-containing protein [Burkholderia]MCA8105033.1 hypothetical protein [Burkholderia sp. AU36459]MDF3094385.1 hypothetical protein [Burkholderia semiarida]MDF3105014.1 hypothetical protein [Burkholderia semiarida]RQV84965.1 hypothetical protein DF160_09030 [Burkholderia anthina]WJN74593.1 hypothetical protein OH687_30225 [Burkholderia anthina]
MNLDSKLLMSLKKRSGNVVLRRELAGLGSSSHLSTALQRLVAEGRLTRLGAGVYAKTDSDLEGNARFAVGNEVLLREALGKLGVEVIDVTIQHENGRTVCLVNTGRSRISRKLGWGNITVRYVGEQESPSTGAVPRLPADVDKLPTRNVGTFVERLAQAYDVQYRRSGLDDFAEAVTRVAGDDVELDRTGKLLVALKKQHRINGRQFARLMANHIREIKRVRPVRGLRHQGLSA